MTSRIERMSDEFTKFHLGDGSAVHYFTGPDRGGPHDHPWSFRSKILDGGYVKRVYRIHDDGTWSSETIARLPGDVFEVAATHIHEIIALPAGPCLTRVWAGPEERDTCFWRFDADGVAYRPWHQATFVRLDDGRRAA